MQPLSPHDQFFKKALENPVIAREFFTTHLPAQIREIVDLAHLKIEKESFIDDSLRKSFLDVLFTTSFAGKAGYLWLLVEHQSSNDHFMSFRLLRYMTNIWQRYLEEHKEARTLPLIYPLIIYNGKAKYTAPLSIWQLFTNEELARFCLSQFQLINLNEIPDGEFKKNIWSGILEYFMKHIFERNFLEVLENGKEMLVKAHIQDQNEALAYLKLILCYNAKKVNEENLSSLRALINEITTERDEEIMASLAEVWEREGMEKGIQQGMQQGRKEAEEKARLEKLQIAKKLLARGDSLADVTELTGLSNPELKQL